MNLEDLVDILNKLKGRTLALAKIESNPQPDVLIIWFDETAREPCARVEIPVANLKREMSGNFYSYVEA